MLRITRHVENSRCTTLKVEGRIVADWVLVLQQAIEAELASERALELDFTDVSFIDELGIRMLRDRLHDTLSIGRCPGWIRVLLDPPPESG